MKREIILRASKSMTSSNFNLNKLPEAGRMDVVCACVSNSLFVSHHIRRDTIMHVVMEGRSDPPKVVSFDGEFIGKLGFDERSIAKAIKEALAVGENLKMGDVRDVVSGIVVSKKSFEGLLKERMEENDQLIFLDKKGGDIREAEFKDRVLIVFGDYIGMPKKTEKFLERFNPEKVSLGPTMLFAYHCMILIHNEMDRKRPPMKLIED